MMEKEGIIYARVTGIPVMNNRYQPFTVPVGVQRALQNLSTLSSLQYSPKKLSESSFMDMKNPYLARLLSPVAFIFIFPEIPGYLSIPIIKLVYLVYLHTPMQGGLTCCIFSGIIYSRCMDTVKKVLVIPGKDHLFLLHT